MNKSCKAFFAEGHGVVISENVLHQPLDGESVLLDIAGGNYYGLNEVGSRIWDLMQDGHSFSSIVEILMGEYSVGEAVLLRDIRQFLTQLEDTGIISIDDGTSGA